MTVISMCFYIEYDSRRRRRRRRRYSGLREKEEMMIHTDSQRRLSYFL
jgi:hypothetical protein